MADPICKLIIAGPGAGKTHNMVELVYQATANLPFNRQLAVITYTNEATKTINERLMAKIDIPRNVFVGTIHGFLIRYFIEPYSALLGLLPKHINYIDSAKLHYKHKNYSIQKNIEKNIASDLASKGIVSFDKILELSFQIVSCERIALAISNRLSFVFIDEYQDSRMYQHNIFQKIINAGKTKVVAVGDPMQSIFTFVYAQSQLKKEPKPASYIETPILQMKQAGESLPEYKNEVIVENRRSSPKIVRFLNRLNKEIQQTPVREENNVPVIFISGKDINHLVKAFFQCKEKYKADICTDKYLTHLVLAKQWAAHDAITCGIRLEKIGSHDNSSKELLKEAIRCICALTNTNALQLTHEKKISTLALRKFAFKIIRYVKKKQFNDYEHMTNTIRKAFETEFSLKLDTTHKGNVNVEHTINNLCKSLGHQVQCECYFSTIHSAKGLEANSVLVIANTLNSLSRWLGISDSVTKESLADENNLGFVGFSRAREMLCVGCLQDTTSIIPRINELGMEIIAAN